MKILKNILGRIFAFWALIVFVITMLPAFILIALAGLLKEPKSTATFQQVSKVWMRIFFFFTGIRISIKGKEYFKKGETYIVSCNHNSLMDVPMTTPFIPGPNKTIAKKEMASIPIFGIIYKRGSVLVDRKSEESRKKSFDSMKKVLNTGMHMCVYPEGTRNKTTAPLQPFYNGAFRLSKETGHAIMPAVLFNTSKVLPIHKTFFFWPVKIKMHFLPPVYPEGLSNDELNKKVFEIIKDYYLKNKE
jgi:1-acyl-sn-glycerol-3-phosphate acyltransferase